MLDSSNSELMRRFKGGPGTPPRPEPILLVAEQQSAGRGRLGRSWQGRRGDSLMFSLGLPLQPADWSGLSLAVGISVAESLDPASPGKPTRIGLKWPNDLWLSTPQGECKLAGILVETASWEGIRYVVIGVGINLRTPPAPPAEADDEPAALARRVISPGTLHDLDPAIDAAGALLRVAAPLVQAVQSFEQFGFAPFQARFAARDVLAGRAVALSDGRDGAAHGVAENGALLVHTAAGMMTITSSEVSVRPVSAAAGKPTGVRPC